MKIGKFEIWTMGKERRCDARQERKYVCWTCKRKWEIDEPAEYLWHIKYCCAGTSAAQDRPS
ncbi:MAG: hypothetical protein KGH61_04650 [Candidatus Micrarchaeota archaeon]|nr:hypothetical protein [Candidatus Micrarchaeota archaeon]MDE1848207.1 hypothetical protein [Candidatus Micrarchaeota archaeon]MDE1864855.1 hypothetical protein [Candidatus Micrarchaeota archaeon]